MENIRQYLILMFTKNLELNVYGKFSLSLKGGTLVIEFLFMQLKNTHSLCGIFKVDKMTQEEMNHNKQNKEKESVHFY